MNQRTGDKEKMSNSRSIKFRAWDGKKMQYDVFPTSNNTVGRWVETGGGIELRFCDSGGTKVDIMQFTGLKDKKRTEEYPEGQEIYEGDLFKTTDKHGYSSNCIVEVLFDKESSAFVAQLNRQDELEVGAELLPDYKRNFPDSFEIIGNIHQNPELTEAQNGN